MYLKLSKNKNRKPSSRFVKKSLASHAWVGLVVGVLMYLICLTGTLLVFSEEFLRWEQADIPESYHYSPDQLERAMHFAMNANVGLSDTKFSKIAFYLPDISAPRLRVRFNGEHRYVNEDGTLGRTVELSWSHLLKSLHINLHLPVNIGVVVVGCLGGMLFSLIVSGICAHPRIFKDAFCLRLGGSKHLEQADIHNRLSVWGVPFYVMIAITGAYIGLSSIFTAMSGYVFFEGDASKVKPAVYGKKTSMNLSEQPINIDAALNSLQEELPDAKPITIKIYNMNTLSQYIEIGATMPGRLIYSELFRFDANGNRIDHQGFSDGPVARQVAYSVYRLHFGSFDGLAAKLLYGVLGLALTIISVTGINIWFSKRKFTSYLNHIWVGIVWGVPLALCVAAMFALQEKSASQGFFLGAGGAVFLSCFINSEVRSRFYLLILLMASLIIVVLFHYIRFNSESGNTVAQVINVVYIIMATFIGSYLWFLKQTKNKTNDSDIDDSDNKVLSREVV